MTIQHELRLAVRKIAIDVSRYNAAQSDAARALGRHALKLEPMAFGARYLSDRLLPLPSQWKHTTFHAVVTR